MWQYFTEDELRCKGTDECCMDEQFMLTLEALRQEFNEPMIISSAYRDLSYNQVIGGAKNSPHLFGKAVDVVISGKKAYRLIKLAIQYGFSGIGVSQRGSMRRDSYTLIRWRTVRHTQDRGYGAINS